MRWRHELPHEVNESVNRLVRLAHPHKEAFVMGRHIRTNQIWCALAEVHTELKSTQARLAQAEEELIKVKNNLRRTGEHLVES